MSLGFITRLLSAAKLRVTQIASDTNGSVQTVNVNLVLDQDPDLKAATKALLDFSRKDTKAFQTITDYLRNVDPSQCDDLERSLMQNWLRKVVAAQHIQSARATIHSRHFRLVMMDTSLYDQAVGSWTENKDFLEVVAFDSLLATHLRRKGEPSPVVRVFFVPNSAFLTQHMDYVSKTILGQVQRGIDCAVARADYVSLVSDDLVCDLFLVRNELVCVIQKPYWQFEVHRDLRTVRHYYERAITVLESAYAFTATMSNQHEVVSLLQQLARV